MEAVRPAHICLLLHYHTNRLPHTLEKKSGDGWEVDAMHSLTFNNLKSLWKVFGKFINNKQLGFHPWEHMWCNCLHIPDRGFSSMTHNLLFIAKKKKKEAATSSFCVPCETVQKMRCWQFFFDR